MKKAKPMPPTKKITTKGNNVTKKDIQPSVKTGQKAGSNKASKVEPNGELPYKNPVLKPSLTKKPQTTRKILFAAQPLQPVPAPMTVQENAGLNKADDNKFPEEQTDADTMDEDPGEIDEIPAMGGLSKDDRISMLTMELKRAEAKAETIANKKRMRTTKERANNKRVQLLNQSEML